MSFPPPSLNLERQAGYIYPLTAPVLPRPIYVIIIDQIDNVLGDVISRNHYYLTDFAHLGTLPELVGFHPSFQLAINIFPFNSLSVL